MYYYITLEIKWFKSEKGGIFGRAYSAFLGSLYEMAACLFCIKRIRCIFKRKTNKYIHLIFFSQVHIALLGSSFHFAAPQGIASIRGPDLNLSKYLRNAFVF